MVVSAPVTPRLSQRAVFHFGFLTRPKKTNADFLSELDQLTRRVEPVSACASCVPRGLASMKALKAS